MKKLIGSMLLLIVAGGTQAQTFKHDGIKTGFGFAELSGNNMSAGWTASIGYQKTSWKNRVRVIPSFSFGTQSTRRITDIGDSYFTDLGLNTDVFITLIRIKSISVFAGGGLFVHHLNGMSTTHEDTYFRETYGGWSLGAGLRVAPKKCRLAFEVVPLSYYKGRGYELYSSKLQMDIRLFRDQ